MSFALNEIEALSRKAARGAGFTWGLAEEAAKATRWLCRHDIDGCRALINLLRKMERRGEFSRIRPADINDWSMIDQCLCPVNVGIHLLDRSDLINDHGNEIYIQRVAEPMLLVFFIAVIAKRMGVTTSLVWSETIAMTDGQTVSISEVTNNPESGVFLTFSNSPNQGVLRPSNSLRNRANPDPAVLQELHAFANRTHAPSNAQSRQTGAGAGLADND